jgi:hypothetical protein
MVSGANGKDERDHHLMQSIPFLMHQVRSPMIANHFSLKLPHNSKHTSKLFTLFYLHSHSRRRMSNSRDALLMHSCESCRTDSWQTRLS